MKTARSAHCNRMNSTARKVIDESRSAIIILSDIWSIHVPRVLLMRSERKGKDVEKADGDGNFQVSGKRWQLGSTVRRMFPQQINKINLLSYIENDLSVCARSGWTGRRTSCSEKKSPPERTNVEVLDTSPSSHLLLFHNLRHYFQSIHKMCRQCSNNDSQWISRKLGQDEMKGHQVDELILPRGVRQ